jgi:hypothetical protein
MHPCAIGGVQRDQSHAQERFAVLGRRDRAFNQTEVLGPELAHWLLDQQYLTIDAPGHAFVLPLICAPIYHRDGAPSTSPVSSLPEAQRRARELRADLNSRGVHPDVLRFCREELLVDNYFHAVMEAVKSVADMGRWGLQDPLSGSSFC